MNSQITRNGKILGGYVPNNVISAIEDWDIKDIQIKVSCDGASGTEISSIDHTIFEVVPAHSLRRFKPIDLGFFDTRTAGAGAVIEDFDFVQPHLSLEEMKSAIAAAQKVAATNAVLAKAANEKSKKTADAAALKFNQDAAAKGDAYGLFRMGERYRDGNGVEKDLAKAKDCFQKSAAGGNQDAALALKKLSE